MGELDWWSGTGCHLAFDGSLVLAENIRTAARRQLARLEIQYEIDLPGFKTVALDLSVQKFVEQASESNELMLALLVLICRHHGELIGGIGAEL